MLWIYQKYKDATVIFAANTLFTKFIRLAQRRSEASSPMAKGYSKGR